MTTASVPIQIVEGAEPIAGYKLVEQLGTGGYGEVWKVDAPGGLAKAIKFVYGRMDEVRAERELKALHRVRDLSHPFLLSLERIEVVSGQLIIVTELAGQSLKDRFAACRKSGQQGIERSELLGYLRDAADALDYMREHCGLQHLDIKPENLLIVGSHVKVADFGLVKQLEETSASLVSGLTPIYAAPELFDFRATPHSDQYSLAIVYQEMLTGVLPFPGRTPAQLATQHLHSRPMVTALPPEDRAAVTRALSKDPEKRFSDCRALMDSLSQSLSATPAPSAPRSTAPSTGQSKVDRLSDLSGATQVVGADDTDNPDDAEDLERPLASHTEAIDSVLPDSSVRRPTKPVDWSIKNSESNSQIVHLASIDTAGVESGLRPTVFIGLGGIGNQALSRLHHRLHERFEGVSKVPIFQFLAIDTDVKALDKLSPREDDAALAARDTLAMPLRRPHDYRSASPKFLRWLSRRWLYNIPRSLQTEGIRPLGRLAYVDSADHISERIREAIATCTSRESAEATAKATKLGFRTDSPRVFIVASISGGTGSGALLDVAAAARNALAELNLADDGLGAILTHGTGKNQGLNDLAVSNAYACLSEIYHSLQVQEAPSGDQENPSTGASERGAIRDAYVLNLGEELTDEQFDSAIDDLATYLFVDAVTSAGSLLDMSRDLGRGVLSVASEGPQLRTFGLRPLLCDVAGAAYREEDKLCQAVVQNWLNGAKSVESFDDENDTSLIDSEDSIEVPVSYSPPGNDEIEREARECCESLGIDGESLVERLFADAQSELGGDLTGISKELGQKPVKPRSEASGDEAQTSPAAEFLLEVGRILGPRPGEKRRRAASESLAQQLNPHTEALLGEHVSSMRGLVMGLLDDPHARIPAAQRAAEELREYIEAQKDLVTQLAKGARSQVGIAERELYAVDAEDAQKKGSWLKRRRRRAARDEQNLRYLEARVREVVVQKLAGMLEAEQRQVTEMASLLTHLRRMLGRISEEYGAAAEKQNESSEADGLRPADASTRSISAMLKPMLPQLTMLVDFKFQARFLEKQGGLAALADDRSNLSVRIIDVLRKAARGELRRAVASVDAGKLFLERYGEPDEAKEKVREHIEDSIPSLLACGGATRLLVVLPNGEAAASMQELIAAAVDDTPTTVIDEGRDIVFCYEAEQIPLVEVANKLIEYRPYCAEVAARIHTRTDVDWIDIPSPE